MMDIKEIKPILNKLFDRSQSGLVLSAQEKKTLSVYLTHLAFKLQVERKNRKRFINACITFNNALKE